MSVLSRLFHARRCAIDKTVMSIVDQGDVQEVIKKIVAELQRRKFLVWFDRKGRIRAHPCLNTTLGSDSCAPSLQCSI